MRVHIPAEQYGFIEADVESVLEARELSDEVKRTFSDSSALSQKDFNKALDRYLTDGTGETETYLAMNKEQKAVIQEVKKAFGRLGASEDNLPTRGQISG